MQRIPKSLSQNLFKSHQRPGTLELPWGIGMCCKLTVTFMLVGMCILQSGCTKKASQSSNSKRRNSIEREEAAQQLLDSVIYDLGTMPDRVNLILTPPQIILDASKTFDREEILAVGGSEELFTEMTDSKSKVQPDRKPYKDEKFDLIFVQSGNINFKLMKVKSGDVIRFYAKQDETAAGLGFAQYDKYIERRIEQVLNEFLLKLEIPLSEPVLNPAKLQIWRYVDDRKEDIQRYHQVYEYKGFAAFDNKPAFGWEPSPDAVALQQICQRLTQWAHQAKQPKSWQVEPLLEKFPKAWLSKQRLGNFISKEALSDLEFQTHEGRWLQQAVWLRDISLWANGDSLEPIEQATALFDWTIRNIQLIDDKETPPREAWEVLLYGKGTSAQRAEIFALLCAQMKLDVVMLSPEDSKDSTAPLLSALLLDKKLYLFDTALGLPISGPKGIGVATLEQAQQSDAIFRALDVKEEFTYGWTAEEAKNVTAGIVASPFSLSIRAAMLEPEMLGNDAVVLTTDVAAIKKKLVATKRIKQVDLWKEPFNTILKKRGLVAAKDPNRQGEKQKRKTRERASESFRTFSEIPLLWKARVLHFQGNRPALNYNMQKDAEGRSDKHLDAQRLYRNARLPERRLKKIGKAGRKDLYVKANQNAAYWIGLLLYDSENAKGAVEWLKNRTLEATIPTPWKDSATYNLARCYEKIGQMNKAIELYKNDKSPQRHGNLLRAKALSKELKNPSEEKPSSKDKSEN